MVSDQVITKTKRPSRLRRMLSGLKIVFESKIATFGLIMVLFWVVLGIVSLFWTPFNPNATDFTQNLPPNAENWLGTDHLGRKQCQNRADADRQQGRHPYPQFEPCHLAVNVFE